jgi:hypothetical protein
MRPSVNTEDLKNWTEQHIMKNRCSSLDETNEKFPQIYRSLIYGTAMEHLHYKTNCDKTQVSHINTESKYQSLEWQYSHSLPKPIKFKQMSNQRGQNGVHLVEFISKCQAINAASCCATLKWLQCAIKNHWQRQLSAGVVRLHDNPHPHTAITTCVLLRCLGRFLHPPYNSQLASSDFTCSHI